MPFSGPVAAIASPTVHGTDTCAVTRAGGVECIEWTDESPVANPVAGLSSGVTAVATGGFHACVVTSGGGVSCWVPPFEGERVPVPIPGFGPP